MMTFRNWLISLLTPKQVQPGTMGSLQKIFDLVKDLETPGDGDLEKKICEQGPAVTGFLIAGLNHQSAAVRLRIIRVMGKLKDVRFVDDLICRLRDANEAPAVRDEAGNALAEIKSIRAVDELIEIIANPDGTTEWRAASVLSRMGWLGVPRLIGLLRSSSNSVSKSIALAVLRQVSGQTYGENPLEWQEWADVVIKDGKEGEKKC